MGNVLPIDFNLFANWMREKSLEIAGIDLNIESYSKGRLNKDVSSKRTRDSNPVLLAGNGLSYS